MENCLENQSRIRNTSTRSRLRLQGRKSPRRAAMILCVSGTHKLELRRGTTSGMTTRSSQSAITPMASLSPPVVPISPRGFGRSKPASKLALQWRSRGQLRASATSEAVARCSPPALKIGTLTVMILRPAPLFFPVCRIQPELFL